MNIKCFLFIDHFTSPVKIMVMENVSENKTDDEIIKEAKEHFLKGFRVEIEDARNPLHPPYGYGKSNQRKPSRIPVDIIEEVDYLILKVNGNITRAKDIREKHKLSHGRYNYLRSVLKHSLKEIWIHGNNLMKRESNKR